MSFRPTHAQAFGHGAYLGGLVGVGAGLILFGMSILYGMTTWIPVVPIVIGGVLGGLSGLFFGRDAGADIDDLGIYAVPRGIGGNAQWQRVAELRTERRGGRTRVTVFTDSGAFVRLRAPYSGRLLAADPEFERKLFMLRNLWETHRTFARGHHQPPLDGL